MAVMNQSYKYCSAENKPCIGWVETYFHDCLCNFKDQVSFTCGFISLICWAVAEIPQIFTNFINKSGHGVSLPFLLAWVLGDIFNLVGCLLEPATLPTQYYTALLYTVSTILLVLQCVYYDYIGRWWKQRKNKQSHYDDEDAKKPLNDTNSTGSVTNTTISSSSIFIPSRASSRDLYYTSARSLASSGTPPIGSYLRPARSGPSALQDINGSSDDDDLHNTTISVPSQNPKRISRSVGYGTFFATCAALPVQNKAAIMEGHMGLSGRRLLMLNNGGSGGHHGVLGIWLGWMMAAIYMGGRIPQIWLNIKRGSVEGLNPLMFIFALIANVTYVASILVRSTDWKKIRPNMPWLLDAIVCVVLDLFIILQYVYYRLKERRTRNRAQGCKNTSDYYYEKVEK
ncbi:hypothetical protein Sjap_016838 [Stephania japonica]|uniref:Vacuolar amino acid transporter YPQ1 n=1 Tax=Stephania japonica TaxID=461633 RepID=A0AAP0I517_9MAGN